MLVATVSLLNGFGVINQTIPAKEMPGGGVSPAIAPLAMIGDRAVEVIAGFGLAFGVFPRLSALALFVFLVLVTFVLQFQGWLINKRSRPW